MKHVHVFVSVSIFVSVLAYGYVGVCFDACASPVHWYFFFVLSWLLTNALRHIYGCMRMCVWICIIHTHAYAWVRMQITDIRVLEGISSDRRQLHVFKVYLTACVWRCKGLCRGRIRRHKVNWKHVSDIVLNIRRESCRISHAMIGKEILTTPRFMVLT